MLSDHQELKVKSLSNLAKSRYVYSKSNKNKIPFLLHPSKGRVETDKHMMEVATNFYQELYDGKPIDTSYCRELFNDITPLNQDEIKNLERDITMNECDEALKSMSLGPAPSDDGITIEIWRYIFALTGQHFLRLINVAKNGHFHNGFLNALLIPLKKRQF
jgi:hypothetical protein